MLKLVIVLLLSSQFSFAATLDGEADLQEPVSDLSQMSRQEQQEVPTIDEVQMVEKEEAEPKEELQTNHEELKKGTYKK